MEVGISHTLLAMVEIGAVEKLNFSSSNCPSEVSCGLKRFHLINITPDPGTCCIWKHVQCTVVQQLFETGLAFFVRVSRKESPPVLDIRHDLTHPTSNTSITLSGYMAQSPPCFLELNCIDE